VAFLSVGLGNISIYEATDRALSFAPREFTVVPSKRPWATAEEHRAMSLRDLVVSCAPRHSRLRRQTVARMATGPDRPALTTRGLREALIRAGENLTYRIALDRGKLPRADESEMGALP